LKARPPLDDSESRKIRRLAGARHAPADWTERARIIALSWDGLGVGLVRESRPQLLASSDRGPNPAKSLFASFDPTRSAADVQSDASRPGPPDSSQATGPRVRG
jgi:hypothetical protein